MKKLILIEDNEDMLSLLSDLLSLEGFAVIGYCGKENNAEIMASLREEKPNLVLLDAHIPGMDSFMLLRDIRQDQEIANTQILMSSGMPLEEESQQAGADGFIAKPFMPDELIEKIKTMIGNYPNGEKT